jgi:hypothetical protein
MNIYAGSNVANHTVTSENIDYSERRNGFWVLKSYAIHKPGFKEKSPPECETV